MVKCNFEFKPGVPCTKTAGSCGCCFRHCVTWGRIKMGITCGTHERYARTNKGKNTLRGLVREEAIVRQKAEALAGCFLPEGATAATATDQGATADDGITTANGPMQQQTEGDAESRIGEKDDDSAMQDEQPSASAQSRPEIMEDEDEAQQPILPEKDANNNVQYQAPRKTGLDEHDGSFLLLGDISGQDRADLLLQELRRTKQQDDCFFFVDGSVPVQERHRMLFAEVLRAEHAIRTIVDGITAQIEKLQSDHSNLQKQIEQMEAQQKKLREMLDQAEQNIAVSLAEVANMQETVTLAKALFVQHGNLVEAAAPEEDAINDAFRVVYRKYQGIRSSDKRLEVIVREIRTLVSFSQVAELRDTLLGIAEHGSIERYLQQHKQTSMASEHREGIERIQQDMERLRQRQDELLLQVKRMEAERASYDRR